MSKPGSRQVLFTAAAVATVWLAAVLWCAAGSAVGPEIAAAAAAETEAASDAETEAAAAATAEATTTEAAGDPLPVPSAAPESALEVRIFRLLNGGASNPVLDLVMPLVTDFRRNRVPLFFVWVALLIFGKRKGRLAALMLIPLIAASDQLSSSLIKPLVQRLRPCELLGEVRLWNGPQGWITTPAEVARGYKTSWSFPSGHATNITAAMLFLGLAYRRLLPALLSVALLVSWSRIYVGVHWPLDAAAGMALGAGLAWPAWLVLDRFVRGGLHDKHGADGLLDDAGGSASKKEPPRPV